MGGDVAGEQCGEGEGEVAGGLVEAHGQSTAAGADEVDLHDDGGGPGQSLADAEQDVRGHHHPPSWRPDEQQRDGYGDQPAGHQHRFAAVALGPGAGEVVGQCLREAEGEDVGERGGVRVEPEDVSREQGQDRAFLAEHAAHQGVDRDEQDELGGVGAEPEDRRCGSRRGLHGPVSNS